MISKKDSGQVTQLSINLTQKFQINKLHLNITGLPYYRRRVLVFETAKNESRSIADTVLSFSGTTDVMLLVRANHLQLRIENRINNPYQLSPWRPTSLRNRSSVT